MAIGNNAGNSNQGISAVAIGNNAARLTQGNYSVALGINAAEYTQGTSSVALGYAAAQSNQGTNAVSLGYAAGQYTQGNNAVALGYAAGQTNQGANSVALGASTVAAYTNSTAIGYQASTNADNTIQLGNSSVANVNTSGAVNAKSFYLNSSTAITSATTTTIDLSLSNIFKVSLGTDISVLTLNNVKPGTYIIEFIQGGTYNVTFPTTNWKWAAGLVPIITQTSGKIDIVTLVYDGSTYFASTVQNF